MDDLRVPTVQVDATVLGTDGVELDGVIFTPTFSAVHAGPMGAEEWINAPTTFFPFRRTTDERAFLLNKHQVLALAVAAHSLDDRQNESQLPARHVVVEVGPRRIEGQIIIDMPLNQQRILDYVNCPEAFLPLLGDDGRDYLVRKACICRITEIGGK